MSFPLSQVEHLMILQQAVLDLQEQVSKLESQFERLSKQTDPDERDGNG